MMDIDAVRDHGRVVWGQLKRTSPIWAGVIISTKTLDLVYVEKEEKTWIFWLADKTLSNIENKFIYDLSHEYAKHTKKLTGNRKKSVIEAIEITAHQFNISVPVDVIRTEHIILWAGQFLFKNIQNQIGKSKRHHTYYIPDEIIKEIRVMNSRKINQDYRRCIAKNPFSLHTNCLGCKNEIVGNKIEHPLFVGFLCESCQGKLKNYIMTICDDMYNDVCCICCIKANYEVVLCNNCIRIYCEKCLSRLGGKSLFKSIVEITNWSCYACCQNSAIPCLLRRKSTNQQLYNIFSFYRPQSKCIEPKLCSIPEINILALNDAQNLVSSVLNVLDYPHKLENISIMEDNFLRYYKPPQCHLLIQYYSNNDDTNGLPCNMKEFFAFILIKNKIEADNKANGNVAPFFWAFECCSGISFTDRDTISRFCECEPDLITVGVKNVYQRGRFIWTNICLPPKDVLRAQKHNILVQKIPETELKDEGTHICYESVYLMLTSLIRHNIK